MPSTRKRQRTLDEFTSSSSPPRISRRKKAKAVSISHNSEDRSDSDPGKIRFEHKASKVKHVDKELYSDLNDREGDFGPLHSSPLRKPQKTSSVISVGSSSSSSEEGGLVPRKRSMCSRLLDPVVVTSDESDTQPLKKKRRLVKGKRPEPSSPDAEEGNDEANVEDLIKEVDQDKILDSRLRVRSKKSAFAYNLERLQRRRRGEISTSESEDDGVESSEPSRVAHPPTSDLIEGARRTNTISDKDEGLDRGTTENEDENDFIVESGDAEDVPELPTMFSMGTFQDLSHHFKVICQLFVHLAVQEPHTRRSFMKEALKKNYFSVPLIIARRKLSSIKDSLVASSVWKPDFKTPLEKFPIFHLEQLDFAVPLCDACHLGNRVATLRGVLLGHEYDSLTYEPRQAFAQGGDEEFHAADWNLGRFCAARAQVFHTFTHWEHILYHTLHAEVGRLREGASQRAGSRLGGRQIREGRVFIPATNGPPPPEDLEDADRMMDWLDGRGIINAEWTKIKRMMERAHNLEAKGKNDDDLELE